MPRKEQWFHGLFCETCFVSMVEKQLLLISLRVYFIFRSLSCREFISLEVYVFPEKSCRIQENLYE